MIRKQLLFFAFLIGCSVAQAQSPIGTAEALQGMSMDGNYYLTADLTVENWTPLGVFTGTLDGRGHLITIQNGLPDSDGYQGLFAQTNGAVIRNLFIEGKLFWATNACGGMVAHAVNTTIDNCQTALLMVTHDPDAILAGMVGVMEGGTITNSSCNNRLEGYKTGGIAGTTSNTSAIRNCYARTSFIIRDETLSAMGGLVYENHGTIENTYLQSEDSDWFTPSIGQLNRIYCTRPIFKNLGASIKFYDGFCVSSTLQSGGFIHSIDEDGMITRRSVESFSNNTGEKIRMVHEVFGVGYNVGDLLNICGTRSVVFYVNDDGYGGLVTTCESDLVYSGLGSAFIGLGNDATSDYYLPGTNIQLMNQDYAQTHGGTVIDGSTVNTIPESYQQNNGLYFTQLLANADNNPAHKINKLIPASSGQTSSTSVKQLAFANYGTINQCYYPLETTVFALVNHGSVTNCRRFSSSNPPYRYGEYGSRIFDGNERTATRLSSLLNDWVDSHGTDLYARWTNPTTTYVNSDLPILKYDFNNGSNIVNTASRVSKKKRLQVLRYTHLNAIPSSYTSSDCEHVYYGQESSINANNVTTPWDSPLMLTEEATLKGSYSLKANTCVLFDNSDGSDFGGANYDWHFFSSPFSDNPVGINYNNYTNGGAHGNPTQVKFQNDKGFFPTDTPYTSWDFYCYDEPDLGWINFKRKKGDHYHSESGAPISYSNETNLIPGKGYLWAIDAQTCLMGEGRLNNGNVTITLSRASERCPGYNLVGNPYMAYLDMDAFLDDNAGVLTQQGYLLLDADQQGYVSYHPGVSDNPVYAPRYLHSHQGFFVQAASHNASLTFKTSQTSVTQQSEFRGCHDPNRPSTTPENRENYPLVNLILSDDQGRKEYTTVELERPETGGLLKMQGLTNCNAELSISHQSQEYGIAFLGHEVSSVPIRLQVNRNGIFSLHWSTYHHNFSYLHLVDNLTGADVDCLNTGEYVFSATTNDFRSRFKLLLRPFNAIEEPEEPLDTPFAFVQDRQVLVHGQGQVELHDLTGRLLRSMNTTEAVTIVPAEGLASGVYLLRLATPRNSKVQKLIIP